MRMKKLLITSIVIFITQSAFALMSDKPAICPSVNAIQSVGVSVAEKCQYGFCSDDMWMAFEMRNSYGTEDDWTFGMISVMHVNSANDAVARANEILSSLTFIRGPEQFITPDGRLVWECRYEGRNPYFQGVAVTPAIQDLAKLSRFFK